MFRPLLFILLFTLTGPSAFGLHCPEWIKDFFNKGTSPYDGVPEYKLLKTINAVEAQGNFMRNLRGNVEPAINTRLRKELAKHDAYLLEGVYSRANRAWRPLFRKVEMAHVLIKKNKMVMEVLKELPNDESFGVIRAKLKNKGLDDEFISVILDQYNEANKSLSKLQYKIQGILNREMVVLGNNYHRYALVRHHLEELLVESNCDAACKVNIKRMLDTMGLNSYHEEARFKRLIVGESQPTFREVGELLNENPLAILTRLKKERNFEIPAALKHALVQETLLEELYQFTINFPGVHKTRAVRLFKLIYDEQARTLHFPAIARVVRSTKSTKEKYYLLKDVAVVEDGDDILTTFARRVDQRTNETWKTLREYIEANDQDFFERILKAEKTARRRGDISLVNEDSPLAKFMILSMAAGGAIGYMYFGFDQSNTEDVTTPDQVIIDDQSNSEEVEVPDHIRQRIEQETKIQLGGEEDQALDEMSEIIKRGSFEKKGGFMWKPSNRLPASHHEDSLFKIWFLESYYGIKFWLFPPGASLP